MSVYTVGRNGFHKGEKTLEAAMDKTMEQDTINIKEKRTSIERTIMVHPGVTIQGDPTQEPPLLIGPLKQPLFLVPGDAWGTITLKHVRVQLDENSIGMRVNGHIKLVLDDVQFYHKKGLDTPYNSLTIGAQQAPDVEIHNSLIDKMAGIVNTIQVTDSNIGDWYDTDNSQLFLSQGQIQGTELQNILIAGNDKNAQLRLSNCAFGGNVRFQQMDVAGDTIQLTQLPIINHRGNAKPDAGIGDATSLIVGDNARMNLVHVSQSDSLDEDVTKLKLPKWRGLGILAGALTIDDAYLINTGLKNVAQGGDIQFENVTDDSEWKTGSQWGAGPKLHLSNRNSHSELFDAQSKINITGSKIYGETGNGPKQTETALQKLDQMIGLAPVKKQVHTIIAQAKANVERKKRGLPSNSNTRLHMIFEGSAGTGKTTVARLVGQALYEGGVLKSTKFIEARQPDLVSQYVGKTAEKTRQVVQSALDGVLFIDEMYELADPKGGGNSFNSQAVTELIADMENYRDRLVVIGAGYTQDLRDFFKNGNQGLRSRFATVIEFPDYSPLELKEIERLDLQKSGARLANPNVIKLIDKGIDDLLPIASRSKSSGNGRFVDNYVQNITQARDMRIAQAGNMDKLSDLQLMIIQPQDVQVAVQNMKNNLTNMM